jgi:hypothetical protein
MKVMTIYWTKIQHSVMKEYPMKQFGKKILFSKERENSSIIHKVHFKRDGSTKKGHDLILLFSTENFLEQQKIIHAIIQ